ncbi:hypothetical protein JCM8097_005392 [Rhodosporidiobolus ruineniae]
MASLRSSAKTSRLASALNQFRTGPNARQLPALVSSLSVRSEGIKGNAGARHWAKTVLPALHFANPSVKVTVEQPTKKPSSESSSSSSSSDAWSQPPGITVTFTDPALQPAFFPLPAQRSDKLVQRFWATFGQEKTLRQFAEGQEVEVPVEQVAEEAAPAAETAAEEKPVA